MQQLDTTILKEASKLGVKIERAGKKVLKKEGLEIGSRFLCPFCQYVSKKNKQGSAFVYPETMTFFCFACRERRIIK